MNTDDLLQPIRRCVSCKPNRYFLDGNWIEVPSEKHFFGELNMTDTMCPDCQIKQLNQKDKMKTIDKLLKETKDAQDRAFHACEAYESTEEYKSVIAKKQALTAEFSKYFNKRRGLETLRDSQ